MELVNRLPFVAMAFRQFDTDGNLDCVVAVRGTFLHEEGGALAVAPHQEDFQWEDAYDGDPHSGVMLRQTDLTPEKPGTDVTFLGNAYAPAGKTLSSWDVSLQVGPLQKDLTVHGERHWTPVIRSAWDGFSARAPKRVLKDWRLSDPKPATAVPLSWSRSYGGPVPGTGDPDTETAPDAEAYNPLGRGIVNLNMGPHAVPVPAPQVTAAGVALDWRERVEPQGIGPISPWWRFRQQHAGTYDENWLNERHPLLPKDFDPRFWQCAHPDLVAIPYLAGNESYRLENLHPTRPVASGALPDITLGIHCMQHETGEWQMLNLDGVHFDWRTEERVLLTWRIRFPLQNAADVRLTLTRVRLSAPTQTGAAAA
ncbi:DUF2169 domain-containing protein [Agrobacterium sp. a22-2]|uniref:DUF2169 family type VI secretion system accessory protein n=1 Tax=Agrobacterium sp. a22-2 TaxID=2283840 RepID=UPI0014460B50|nr:DUF2169 domain-containing protein [Agrobacterium sp. a22-2]NKN37391.1 DUF2169 domain-containing protein [Agrobacterium sp. a22-2]